MTNINVIENKISSVKKYLAILKTYKKHTAKDLSGDLTLKGAVERYLYLATQATLELGEAFIALRKLRKPSIYSETFEILKEADIIDNELAEKLVNMVGFRNAIAHDYEKLDLDIMCDVLQNKLIDVENFVKSIEKQF
ncbi:MAG: DUF86 domain-containing protein [Patescibacteria group bacterium]